MGAEVGDGRVDRMRQLREGRLDSFDGTTLGYQVHGTAGPWLVICNGLGSSYDSWEPLVERLAPQRRVLIWDYRGLYGSAAPRDPRRLTVGDHARDLEQLLAHEGIAELTLGGWSMGVQLALEGYRRLPAKVRALVLINGTYGRFFSAVLPVPGARRLVLPALRAARLVSPLVGRAVRRGVNAPGFASTMHRLGLVAVDSPRIARAARGFGELDWDRYLAMAAAMQDHDAAPGLRPVRVPTLVVGGGRDLLAPPPVIDTLAREIPRAELFQVPHGTHYTLLEFPELVVAQVADFLGRHVPVSSEPA